jgi:LysM repeat protein
MMDIQLHQVSSYETLSSIARQYGVTPRQIKSLNGLRSAKLKVDQVLLIKVLTDQELKKSSKSNSRNHTGGASQSYRVQAGDTLFGIARKFGLSVDQLKRENGLSTNNLQVGQVLRIFQQSGPVQTLPSSSISHHTVQAGDTLFGIARKHGLSLSALQALNPGVGSNLKIGQKIIIRLSNGGQQFPTPSPQPKPDPRPQPNPNPRPNPGTLPPSGFQLNPSLGTGAKRFTLTLQLPSGQVHNATVQEITRAGLTGMGYNGVSKTPPQVEVLQNFGIPASALRALLFVMEHEGGFDAINTYDLGIFSYGFIQFTGKHRSLDDLLQNIANNAPSLYQHYFASAGILVQNKVVQARNEQGAILSGEAAWQYIRSQFPRLFVPFIQAGFEEACKIEQCRTAYQDYAKPALDSSLSINFPAGVARLNLAQALPAEDVQALAISLAINLGLGGLDQLLEGALNDFVLKRNILTFNELSRVPSSAICQAVIDFVNTKWDPSLDRSKRIINRSQAILNGAYQRIRL